MTNFTITTEPLCIADTYPDKAKTLSEALSLPICQSTQTAALWLDWISDKKGIRNPYFGDKMMKCGIVKGELPLAIESSKKSSSSTLGHRH